MSGFDAQRPCQLNLPRYTTVTNPTQQPVVALHPTRISDYARHQKSTTRELSEFPARDKSKTHLVSVATIC